MVRSTPVAILVLLLYQVVACDKKVDDSGPEEPERSPRDDYDKTTQALLRKILQYAKPSPAPREPGEDAEDDPIYQKVRSSPEYQRLLDSPEYRRLRTNPDFQRLLNNPDYVRLRDNLVRRAVKEASAPLVPNSSGVDSIADYTNTDANSRTYGLVQIFRPRENADLGLGPSGTVQQEESEGALRLSALLEAAREKSLLAELLHVSARPHQSDDHGNHEPSPLYMPVVHDVHNSVSVLCAHPDAVPDHQYVAVDEPVPDHQHVVVDEAVPDHHHEAVDDAIPDHRHVAVDVAAPGTKNSIVEVAAPSPQNTAEAADHQKVSTKAQENDGAPAPAVKTHKDEVLGKIDVIELIRYLEDRVAREEKSGSHVAKTDVEKTDYKSVQPSERVKSENPGRRFFDPGSGSKPSRRPAGKGEPF